MRNADDTTDPKRNVQAAPPRPRSVVRAMIWATVPVLLVVQLLASAGVEVSSFWSQIRQLDARIARTAESRAELIAEPLWKMRYDQVTGVLNEIMHDETIAGRDQTRIARARADDRDIGAGRADAHYGRAESGLGGDVTENEKPLPDTDRAQRIDLVGVGAEIHRCSTLRRNVRNG